MTLQEAIKHAQDAAKKARERNDCQCADDHEQLAVWLRELQVRREADGYDWHL